LERAVDIAGAVRRREVSAEEMVTRALERIEARDADVNSCIQVLDEQALSEARRLDAGGAPEGALAGVPVTVKEIFALAGERCTWGCPGLADAPPAAADDPHVARLKAAGAIVVARTNIPELSCWGHTDNPIYGETRNPWDLTRTPGGSSGGAAASVAIGVAPIGLGSDAGGSVRVPASFSGIVGLKPSFDTLPADAAAQVGRLNCAGTLTGAVADARAALAVLTGRSFEADSIAGVRIGFTEDYGFAPVEPEVRAAFRDAVAAIEAGDVALARAEPPALSPLGFMIPMLECEVYEAFAEVLERGDHGLSPETVAVAEIGNATTGREYFRALGERLEFEAGWREFFTGCDVLLAPTTQVTAFELGRCGPDAIDGHEIDPTADGSWYPTSFIANVIGAAAISIPIGPTAGGLPLGLQVLGPNGTDAMVLAVAEELERLLPPVSRAA
jgi:Asp-tRNA(Asn)/Glu-tRNA(Gln) amidotransferase A subunit family amidase